MASKLILIRRLIAWVKNLAIKSQAVNVFDSVVDPFQSCESVHECYSPATSLVWVDHHRLGCDYTGYRCDIHLNLLMREAMVEMARVMRCGGVAFCVQCEKQKFVGALTDHVRSFRI